MGNDFKWFNCIILLILTVLSIQICGCISDTNLNTQEQNPSTPPIVNLEQKGIECNKKECPVNADTCCNEQCYNSSEMTCIQGILYTGKRVTCGINNKVCKEGYGCCGADCYNLEKDDCRGGNQILVDQKIEYGNVLCGGKYCERRFDGCCGNTCYDSSKFTCEWYIHDPDSGPDSTTMVNVKTLHNSV